MNWQKIRIRAGDYPRAEYLYLKTNWSGRYIKQLKVYHGWLRKDIFASYQIASYQAVDTNTDISVLGGAFGGIVGTALLGGVGALVGIAKGAKKTTEFGVIEFSNGKKLLLEGNPRIMRMLQGTYIA